MRYNGQSRPAGVLFRVKRTGPDNKFYAQAITDHDETALHSVVVRNGQVVCHMC